MADIIRVRLDLTRICENLANTGDFVDETEVRQWLEECGFRMQENGWWLCEEISLESLDRSEILQRHQ